MIYMRVYKCILLIKSRSTRNSIPDSSFVFRLCVIQLDQPTNKKLTNHAPQVVTHTSMNQGTRLATSTIGLVKHLCYWSAMSTYILGIEGNKTTPSKDFSQGSGTNKKNRTTTYGTPQNKRFASSESSFARGLQAFLLLFVQQYHQQWL